MPTPHLPTSPVSVPHVIAHRGASGESPENTAVAFERAIDGGADYVETDAQLTADGEVVILHDATLVRTTDAAAVLPDREPWNVGDLALSELRRLDAGSWFDERYAGTRLLTLDELLDVLGDRVRLDLELKSPDRNPGLGPRVVEVLRRRGWLDGDAGDRLMVCSFDLPVLRAFGEQASGVPLLATGFAVPDDETLAEIASWADGYAPDFRTLDADDAARVRKAGLGLRTWTTDAPDQIRQVVDWGADCVITNYPTVGRAVLEGTEPLPAPAVVVTGVAAGRDAPGGEHVRLRNDGSTPVDLGGWYLRTQAGLRLPLGRSGVVRPGGELLLFTGEGTDSEDRRFVGRPAPVLSVAGDSLGLFTSDHRLVDLYAYVGS